jgi:HAD superfamily hydrolase (TIGR01549 family)
VSAIRHVDGVIFDYYETLTRISFATRVAVFDQIGQDLGLDLPAGCLARGWFELARRDDPLPFDGTAPSFQNFRARWEDRGERLLADAGITGAGPLVADRYNELHARAELYPEVAEVIATLEARYPIGVLSDADREHLDPSLERAHFSRLVTVCSEDVHVYKPHVRSFLAACERLGARPGRTLYVGDSPRSDIEGARRAGLNSVWINRHNAPWPVEFPTALQINSLSALPPRLG